MASRAKLGIYRAKRDFKKTAEPAGREAVAPSEQLRFVIQKHAASHLHYDLRLEWKGVFKSWAVTRGPSINPADKRLAVEVEDHPLDYGDFEGTIPKGEYGGGTVQLWDRGLWAPEPGFPVEQGLRDGHLKFVLAGERLQGSWVLVRIKHNRGRDTRKNWLLIKHQDEYANAQGTDPLLDQDRSVASGRTMDQIARNVGKAPMPFMQAAARQSNPKVAAIAKRSTIAQKSARASAMPAFVEPQLCKLVDRPPSQPGWVHEIKFDGYRVQVQVHGHRAMIRTRNGLDWTQRFPAIAEACGKLRDCTLDGEIVALDAQAAPSFAALQSALSAGRTQDLILFAFDLLSQGTTDLRPLPLRTRKSKLAALLAVKGVDRHLHYVEHFESGADAVLESACQMHLEGIVSKKLDAPYASGRSGFWTKAKCRAGHEVVLGGWTTEAGTLRSLLAGVNRDGHLVYVGRIGTGYGGDVVARLLPRLKRLTTDRSPFAGADAPRKEGNVRWLKPTLVAEIEFAGWTGSGMIRQASFKGLREDKPAREVVAEMPTSVSKRQDPDKALAAKTAAAAPAGRKRTASRTPRKAADASSAATSASAAVMGVTLSKPDKVLWPTAGDGTPVTKLDLAHFYEAVGEWMLPHIKGRPCSLLRAPDGIAGQQFFQRHAMAGMSNLLSLVKIRGDREAYVQIDRLEALAAVAQMGALELHPWNCGEDAPEVAGRLVFDLDPAPDVKFSAVIAGALEIRQRLADVGLESFCKTTGGKGLHVVTPLKGGKAAVKWPEAKNFAHIVCAQMASDAPQKYLDTMSKAKRAGRIFLDYLRNDRMATAVAVLSPRAREGATVSMPLHWKEVRTGLEPKRYTVHSTPALLKKSRPWTDYAHAERALESAMRRLIARGTGKSPR